MFKVVLTAEAAKQLDQLPKPIRARLRLMFERLQAWPNVSSGKPLTGAFGDYRLQFRVEGETIRVDKIGHRDGFYED